MARRRTTGRMSTTDCWARGSSQTVVFCERSPTMLSWRCSAPTPQSLGCSGAATPRWRSSKSGVVCRPGLLSAAALTGYLDRIADFVMVKSAGWVMVEVPARPPKDVVADLQSRRSLPLPELHDVARAPIFLPDGRLLARSGYDSASGILVDLRGLGDVRDDLPRAEAASLLRELLIDFPFADEASLAHAVAMFIQPFVRPLIGGATPLYLVSAPTPGSGKTLLVELVGRVADGTEPPAMTLTGNEEETEKRITALLLGAARLILIDNAVELKSSALSAALTTTSWRGRLLGRSEMVTLPNSAVWCATGNNIELSREIARRSIPIRLDARLERPEERSGFRHPLPSWAIESRASLVSACCGSPRTLSQPEGFSPETLSQAIARGIEPDRQEH